MENEMEKGSELFGILKAILIGLALEAIYFIVGDLVIGRFVKYSVMVFFAYIFFACAAVLCYLVISILRADKTSKVVMAFLTLLSALFLHINCLLHDSVVYYHLHGEFMPLADDLGYFFFIWYLGLVYFIWIPASIIVLMYKHKKEKQAVHKGVYSHEEDNHYV